MIPHGIHFDIPEHVYRADPAYSYSQVTQMLPTPADYKWCKDHKPPHTYAMAAGTLIGRLVLEPERNAFESFSIKPEPRAPNGWEADQHAAGLIPIKTSDIEECKLAAESLRNHPIAGPILTGEGRSEVTIIFDVDGIRCKARIDRVPDETDYLADLKKTRDAQPGRWVDGKTDAYFQQSKFAYQVKDMGYYIQAGLYLHGWNQVCPESPRTRWRNVCVEQDPPCKVMVYELEQAAIKRGLEEFKSLLKKLRECEDSGVWPGYEEKVEVIGLPK